MTTLLKSRDQSMHYYIVLLAIAFASAEDDSRTCGISQICVRDPPGCSPDSKCRFIGSFSRVEDPNQMNIKLKAKSSSSRPYVAIRFSKTRTPVNSTVIYCSPTEGTLRFGFEKDGRVDFASQSTSDRLASLSDTWKESGAVGCEFSHVTKPPKDILAAQSLKSPFYVQLIAGSIASDGFPMSPNSAYTPVNVVDFSAVKHLPLRATTASPDSRKEDSTEQEDAEEDDDHRGELDSGESGRKRKKKTKSKKGKRKEDSNEDNEDEQLEEDENRKKHNRNRSKGKKHKKGKSKSANKTLKLIPGGEDEEDYYNEPMEDDFSSERAESSAVMYRQDVRQLLFSFVMSLVINIRWIQIPLAE